MKKVFVYGTLKRGHGNHRLLKDSKFLGEASIKSDMYSLGAFPAISGKGEREAYGEVFEVDEPTMERLDRLEGYPHFYNRKVVETQHGTAWVYYIEGLGGDGSALIADGRW